MHQDVLGNVTPVERANHQMQPAHRVTDSDELVIRDRYSLRVKLTSRQVAKMYGVPPWLVDQSIAVPGWFGRMRWRVSHFFGRA